MKFNYLLYLLLTTSCLAIAQTGTQHNNTKTEIVFDVDGNSYNTVTIGTQTWMKENMKALHYPDSTLIPGVVTYNNSDSLGKIYGRLYTWDAAMKNSTAERAQGICPNGWHIPSDGEYKTLENYLGGAAVAGGKMKDTTAGYWNTPNKGATNSSGLSMLPGGEYDSYQFRTFRLLNEYAVLWTSTEVSSTKAIERYITNFEESSSPYKWIKTLKYSIRCVKDQGASGVGPEETAPVGFELLQNFPNPFNPETTITYSIPYQSSVSLNIFNTIGQKVKTLVNEVKPAGRHTVPFNAEGLSSGVYFCKITADNNGRIFSDIKKLMLLK